jgi:hypothetical protein
MSETLSEARAHFFAVLADGSYCKCCDRWGKKYRRRLNGTMAAGLCWLVNKMTKTGEPWIDVPRTAPRWLVESNQLPTLKWWGLVEPRPNEDDPQKKDSGYWRATDKGFDFALERIVVPTHVVTYNDIPLSFSAETLHVKDALASKGFDYSEIMESI